MSSRIQHTQAHAGAGAQFFPLFANTLAWVLLLFAPFVFAAHFVSPEINALAFILVGMAVAFFLSMLLVATERFHLHLSSDNQFDGIQKVHTHPVPRIGGAAIFPVCLVGSAWLGEYFFWLTLCGLPVFAAGLVEDVTKQVSVTVRLWASLLSGFMAAAFLGVSLPGLGVPGLDWLFAFAVVAWPVTAFAVAGVANSVNIIDGFNGLASGVVCLLAMALGLMAHSQGDSSLALYAMLVGATALGFNLVNYFTGRIFLGDGGAYFLGFALAGIAVLMVVRNPAVSPWALFIVFSYPVSEVVVSVLRRKLKRASPNQPDQDHLHHRVYGVVGVHASVSKWLWLLVWFTFAVCFGVFNHLGGWAGLLAGLAMVLIYSVVYSGIKYFTYRQ